MSERFRRGAWFKTVPHREPGKRSAVPAVSVFWHMWKTRQWSYRDVENGDLCYLVTGGGAAAEIFSETVIDRVVRVKYFGHADAWSEIEKLRRAAHVTGPSKKRFLDHPETVDRLPARVRRLPALTEAAASAAPGLAHDPAARMGSVLALPAPRAARGLLSAGHFASAARVALAPSAGPAL